MTKKKKPYCRGERLYKWGYSACRRKPTVEFQSWVKGEPNYCQECALKKAWAILTGSTSDYVQRQFKQSLELILEDFSETGEMRLP